MGGRYVFSRTGRLATLLSSLDPSRSRSLRLCILRPASRTLLKFLFLLLCAGYISQLTFVDNRRAGKILISLSSRLNRCDCLLPRFPIQNLQTSRWTTSLCPSLELGFILLSSSIGLMTLSQATHTDHSGCLLGFFY